VAKPQSHTQDNAKLPKSPNGLIDPIWPKRAGINTAVACVLG